MLMMLLFVCCWHLQVVYAPKRSWSPQESAACLFNGTVTFGTGCRIWTDPARTSTTSARSAEGQLPSGVGARDETLHRRSERGGRLRAVLPSLRLCFYRIPHRGGENCAWVLPGTHTHAHTHTTHTYYTFYHSLSVYRCFFIVIIVLMCACMRARKRSCMLIFVSPQSFSCSHKESPQICAFMPIYVLHVAENPHRSASTLLTHVRIFHVLTQATFLWIVEPFVTFQRAFFGGKCGWMDMGRLPPGWGLVLVLVQLSSVQTSYLAAERVQVIWRDGVETVRGHIYMHPDNSLAYPVKTAAQINLMKFNFNQETCFLWRK